MSRVQQALLRIPQTEALENSNGAGSASPGEGGNGLRPGLSAPRQASAPVLPGSVSHPEMGDSIRGLSNPATEQVLKLVRSIFLFQNAHSPRVVVFSSVEGTGSSEICLHAAQLLAAHVAARVCLVSANLHPPHPSSLAGQPDKWYGLAEAVTSSDPVKDFVVRTNYKNLWLMPPGSPAAPSNLLLADRLRARMMELKDEFDYVLIDAPPVTASPNAVVLGQVADGVILILEANSTRRETARVVKETFERASVRLLGAVLNNRTFPIPETLYRKL